MTKRSKSSELGDRLSELPDALILHILSLLPMRDVVRTTVLSKRWKGLWTSVPCLIFDANNTISSATHRRAICSVRNFVNRAMFHWKGTKLQKFSLDFPFDRGSFSSDVDTWLHVAIERGVEELSLDLKRGLYSPPQSLYSCSTIKKASFAHCHLDIKGKVQWSRLTSLRLELDNLSGVAIEKVLSGAPQMETLILRYLDCNEVLNIKSNSLRRLKIERNRNPGKNSAVRICTPNVETLEVSGILYTNYLLENVMSLTRAKVGSNPRSEMAGINQMYGFDPFRENVRYNHANVRYNSHRYHTGNSDFLKGLLEYFFPNIRRIEKVTLSCWFVEVLREIKKENKYMVAPLSDVKFLTLYATSVDYVVDILEIFPALTKLVMLQETGSGTGTYPHFFEIVCASREACISEFEAEKSSEPKSNYFVSPYLRTVEITWAVRDNSIFQFIEIVSKNVRKLEKLVLRVTSTGPEVSWMVATEKLLSVKNSFPAAGVILCQK